MLVKGVSEERARKLHRPEYPETTLFQALVPGSTKILRCHLVTLTHRSRETANESKEPLLLLSSDTWDYFVGSLHRVIMLDRLLPSLWAMPSRPIANPTLNENGMQLNMLQENKRSTTVPSGLFLRWSYWHCIALYPTARQAAARVKTSLRTLSIDCMQMKVWSWLGEWPRGCQVRLGGGTTASLICIPCM